MTDASPTAEVDIHLRARAEDKKMIDRAAKLSGADRSQFMLTSALEKAKSVLLDQSTILVDGETFDKIVDWMSAPPTPEESAGMKWLSQTGRPWRGD